MPILNKDDLWEKMMNWKKLQESHDEFMEYCRANKVEAINLSYDPPIGNGCCVELRTKNNYHECEEYAEEESIQEAFTEAFRKIHPRKALK